MTAKRSLSFVRTLMVGLAVFLGANNAALAQDGQDLKNRLDRLERDIRTLNQQLAGGGGVPSQMPSASSMGGGGDGMSSGALVRLDQIELEVRNLTGAAETLNYQIDQLSRRLDQLMTDLDFRLARLEGTNPGSFSEPQPSAAPTSGAVSKAGSMPPVAPGGGSTGKVQKDGSYQPGQGEVGVLGSMKKGKLEDALTTPQAAPQAAQPAKKDTKASAQSVLPEGTPKDQYTYAFDLTRQARYDEAEVAYRAFLELHGDDELADNARYWLAETYYVRKSYPEAAQAFFEAYQKAPQGQKAADSLLKLGMTMSAMEKTAEACATFGKLRKEFSPLKANVEQTLNREVARLKCK